MKCNCSSFLSFAQKHKNVMFLVWKQSIPVYDKNVVVKFIFLIYYKIICMQSSVFESKNRTWDKFLNMNCTVLYRIGENLQRMA